MDAVLTALVEDRLGPSEQAHLLLTVAQEQISCDYCCALRSPALALFFALKALHLVPGQAVLVSALSPRYYTQVIIDANLVPVYCDVDSATACITKKTIAAALILHSNNPPQCLIVHHSLGFIPDMQSLLELGMPVIADCSRSYGTEVESFGEQKQAAPLSILGLEERDMVTAGGGALLFVTGRRQTIEARALTELPSEYGLPDMNAAMAVVQFREAAKNLAKRKEIASVYTQAALRSQHKRFVYHEYNHYAFPLILETGLKDVLAYTKRHGIVLENAFTDTLIGMGLLNPEQYPESYSLLLRTVLFPLYPRLSTTSIEKVAKLIRTLP
ncbi:MAG: DegT/DnrJ/EryC1/StrS family aminotransferase [Spirochaetaceae bacterium]|jgi:dTDP-4-amino-4,6-dideoxygalactose transaminase|nr:DegT/DnrJ/EryC1/StrS family aminotransferase [Spirochaetaceae bacterium]